jgi:hypothetical protein
MRSLLLLSTLLTGCVCGAYNGGGDTVYSRNSDSLILCENGGFVATLTTGALEGRYTEDTTGDGGGTAVRGDTGELAFVLHANTDGTVSTPELGADPWTHMSLNQTELDHADVLCTDLETRAWWGQP